MTTLESIQSELKIASSPSKAKASAWFFKTGKGQYGEGDVFIGVTLPEQRAIAKKYFGKVSFSDLDSLLNSSIHEYRLIALIILTNIYSKTGDQKIKKAVYDFYLKHIDRINNWDLVDSSAHKIVGNYLTDKDKSLLRIFARSDNMWHRRIAVIATFDFIARGDASESLSIAEMLVNDPEELIHKAVGWMLREVGKRVSVRKEEHFLDNYASTMPRTMLRYAIEHFESKKRQHYLGLKKASIQSK